MPADDFYWNHVDFDSEESNNFNRSYIDPWDLENYAYIRQNVDTSEPYSGISCAGGQPESTSTFIYIPGDSKYGSVMNSDRATSNHVAIEEVDGRVSKHASSPNLYVSRKSNHLRKFDHVQSHPLRNGHDDTGRFRETTTPSNRSKRSRSYSYSDGYEPLRPSQQMYNKIEDAKNKGGRSSPIYDDIKMYSPSSRKFGLSRYGHLKIDYSYSWHNLYKYICN